MPHSFILQDANAWASIDPKPRPALVSAAVAIGRLHGEPTTIVDPARRSGLLARIFGVKRPSPLSDPRLEVLRAISAALTRGVTPLRGDLVAAAHRAGWTSADLRRTFPGAVLPEPA